MNDMTAAAAMAATASAVQRRVRLLGQPHLTDYIDFVREKTVDGAHADVRALADEWRAANDHYYALEQSEAGLADRVRTRRLPPRMAALADAFRATKRFAAAFDALPATIALVELGRLVACQQSIALDHAEALARRLPAQPTPEALFGFCHPENGSSAPVETLRLDRDRFLFTSDSADFRPHETMLLRPDQLSGVPGHDPVAAVVGFAVGFGSNVMHAIRVDGRLILHNGYHRAHALIARGIRYAPCVIQEATRRDELKLVGADAVVEAPEFYCRAARPPLLKDFFDPKIAKVLEVRRMRRVIEVRLDVREHQIVD